MYKLFSKERQITLLISLRYFYQKRKTFVSLNLKNCSCSGTLIKFQMPGSCKLEQFLKADATFMQSVFKTAHHSPKKNAEVYKSKQQQLGSTQKIPAQSHINQGRAKSGQRARIVISFFCVQKNTVKVRLAIIIESYTIASLRLFSGHVTCIRLFNLHKIMRQEYHPYFKDKESIT